MAAAVRLYIGLLCYGDVRGFWYRVMVCWARVVVGSRGRSIEGWAWVGCCIVCWVSDGQSHGDIGNSMSRAIIGA